MWSLLPQRKDVRWLADHFLDSVGEDVDGLVDDLLAGDDGRGEEERVAGHPREEAAVRYGLEHLRADAVGRSEGLLRGPVPDEFHAADHAEAADVADIGMVAQLGTDPIVETGALCRRLAHEVLLLDRVEHGQRYRAADGVAAICIGVHPRLAGAIHDLRDLVADADAAEGEVARRDRLGELQEIRLNAPVLKSEHLAGAAEPRDDLIGHQQHVVLVADLANARKVVVLRHDGAAGALNRLRDEHGHRIGAFLEDGLLEFVRGRDALAPGTRRGFVAVGIGRGDVAEAREAGLEHGPVGAHAGGAHGGHGDAVIALLARDHLRLVRFAAQFPVIARHLDVAVGGLAAAGREVEAVDLGIGDGGKPFGQFDGPRVGTAGVTRGIGHFLHLPRGSLGEIAAAVARSVVPKSGKAVDEPVAVGVGEVHPVAADPDLARTRMLGAVVERVDQVRAVALEKVDFGIVEHCGSPVTGRRIFSASRVHFDDFCGIVKRSGESGGITDLNPEDGLMSLKSVNRAVVMLAAAVSFVLAAGSANAMPSSGAASSQTKAIEHSTKHIKGAVEHVRHRRHRGGVYFYFGSPGYYPYYHRPYYYSPYYYHPRPRYRRYKRYRRSGSCRYWRRQCGRNWGYRNSDFYGCLRYHGCR